MRGGSRRAREWIPGVDDLEGRHLLSVAVRLALPPDTSLPAIALSPLSYAGRLAWSAGVSSLPPSFSQAPSTADGSWPEANGSILAFLGRDIGMRLGHVSGLSPDLPATVSMLPGPDVRLTFDPALARVSLFESAPLLLPGAQAQATAQVQTQATLATATATTQASASAEAPTADPGETGSTPGASVAARENLAAGPPAPETPPIVVPIGAPPLVAPAALPVPPLSGRPTPPVAPGGDRALPPVPPVTGTLWAQPRQDGQNRAPRTAAPAPAVPRVEIVAGLPVVTDQRPTPKRDVPPDEPAIPSAAGLLDVSAPVDHEAMTAAFGRLLGHLKPDRADAEPAESEADPLLLIASLTILEVARRHRRRRSTSESARRPRLAPRSSLWGLS